MQIILMSLSFTTMHGKTGIKENPKEKSGLSENIKAVITIDSTKTYQTISGWEVVFQAGQEEHRKFFEMHKEEIFDGVVDIGINRVRLEVRCETESPVDYFSQFIQGEINLKEWQKSWYQSENDNYDPYTINWDGFKFSRTDYTMENVVLPLKRRLENRGEKLFINACYVDFGPGPFEHKESSLEYGEFVLAIYLHLKRKYNIVPDAWEVKLEADLGDVWSPLQLVDAILVASNRLVDHGFQPAFIAPSCTDARNTVSYFQKMRRYPVIQKYLVELSYHRYDGREKEVIREIAELADNYHVNTSMLEWWHNKNTHRILHEDLKIGNNSAWQVGDIAWIRSENTPTTLFQFDDLKNSQQPPLIKNHQTPYFEHYFKYIRRNAIRIEAKSSTENMNPLAFINRDNRYVIIINSEKGGHFIIKGLPAGKYGFNYSTEYQLNKHLKDESLSSHQDLEGEIPDRGVITIFGYN